MMINHNEIWIACSMDKIWMSSTYVRPSAKTDGHYRPAEVYENERAFSCHCRLLDCRIYISKIQVLGEQLQKLLNEEADDDVIENFLLQIAFFHMTPEFFRMRLKEHTDRAYNDGVIDTQVTIREALGL